MGTAIHGLVVSAALCECYTVGLSRLSLISFYI
jgi:hypothetical protein